MIRHHPSGETLLRLAAGTLAPGLAVVAAAHLETCQQCRAETRRLEALGGVILEDLPPEPLDEDAFNQVLARLDDPAPDRAPRKPRQARNPLPEGLGLPIALRGADIGNWFWVGRGIRYCRVSLPWAPEQRLMMFRVKGGRRVISHTHGGAEFTQVLAGGFTDNTGHYTAGDLAEADETLEHRPVADAEGCICLAALEGGLRLPWLARLRRS